MRIDWWTLTLQVVNVLVLIWLLARFLFRPVADIVSKRQEEAKRLLADAAAAQQQATDARAEADMALANIGSKREQLMAEAHKSAEAEKANLLAQTSQEIAKLHSEAEAALSRDRAAAETAIIERASELSIDIARRLLGRIPPQTAFDAMVVRLCDQILKLPLEARNSLMAPTTADQAIDVITAAPLSERESEHVRSALAQALGTRLLLTFRTDPALLAGIELHSRNTIVRNSWRADLDRIRAELNRDERSRQS
jgi:F-type H+-transporting ATPase subunit b